MRKFLYGFLGTAAVIALVYFTTPPPQPAQAQQVGLVTRNGAFNTTVLTICSNMTTNLVGYVYACPWYRDRQLAVLASFKSVTNEATALKLTFQVSTNGLGASATNWFDIMPPYTTVTFTNNSAITAQTQMCLIPKTTIDSIAQIRINTVQNTSTTNNVTNAVFTWSVLP